MSTSRLDLLTGTQLRKALRTAEQWLAMNRDALNAINVYPVPDGDTGTNMLLTFRAALEAGERSETDAAGAYLDAVARGALLGARGNSGVILSQMMRGFAEALREVTAVDARALCRALEEASRTAYASVSEPVEGTMLTVLRDASEAASDAGKGGETSLPGVLSTAQAAAEASVARTPDLLPLLREAGVVDAGGQGVAVLIAGLRMGVAGETLPEAPDVASGSVELAAIEHQGHGYCTEYLLEPAGNADLDRGALVAALQHAGGDSILVVGDPRALHVHVHMGDPGPALSAGAAAGSLRNIKIDNMQLQHEAWAAAQEAAGPLRAAPSIGLLAVATGAGIAAAFRELGATPLLVEDGAKPSAGALLEAARQAATEHVFVLPNDKDAVMAAEQAAREAPDFISVIPARSLPAGMSAAVAYAPGDSREAIDQAMRTAIGTVRCIEVTHAARAVSLAGVTAAAGQPIALYDGALVASAATTEEALLAGVAAAMDDAACELLTVYLGRDAPQDAEELTRNLLVEAYPEIELEILAGGQPHYPYIVGVE